MSEGTTPGAPVALGPSHSSHQPPPVAGLNISQIGGSDPGQAGHTDGDGDGDGLGLGSGSDAERNNHHHHHRHHVSQISVQSASPPLSPPPPEHSPRENNRLRAHFPDDHRLEETFATRPRPITSNDRAYSGEKDREPAAHRGVWQNIRNWVSDWKEDFGTADARQDVTNILGDSGIDPHVIRKLKDHNRISSIVSTAGFSPTIGLATLTY